MLLLLLLFCFWRRRRMGRGLRRGKLL
ncbi:MAG: hypothetical protein LBN20_02630 [Endomicrobium sp.]|nr:hypothetical protein [Endomicrobium sp.]